MESDAQHAEAISTMYAELFPAATFSEDALKQRSDDDLRYLFRASQLTSIYTADPDVVHDTALAFAEMQRRNIAKKFDYQQMRPEESRVGKECVRTCRFRWTLDN